MLLYLVSQDSLPEVSWELWLVCSLGCGGVLPRQHCAFQTSWHSLGRRVCHTAALAGKEGRSPFSYSLLLLVAQVWGLHCHLQILNASWIIPAVPSLSAQEGL